MPLMPLVVPSIDTSRVPKKPFMNVLSLPLEVLTVFAVSFCCSCSSCICRLKSSIRCWMMRILACVFSSDGCAVCARLPPG